MIGSGQRINAASTRMTVRQAQESLKASLGDMNFSEGVTPQNITFTRLRFSFSTTELSTKTFTLHFANLNNIVAGPYTGKAYTAEGQWAADIPLYWVRWDTTAASDCKEFFFHHHDPAFAFVNALLILKEDALAPDTEEADFATFTRNAKAATEQRMSNEARTYKVLAEDAFNRKDFSGALDAYCQALELYPMWPEGHYNAALLAGELKEYELAAKHMRRYLVLASGAKDAGTAKDKLLLWEHLAKQE
jgi:tetratricopeptide (TPR) repeat protein